MNKQKDLILSFIIGLSLLIMYFLLGVATSLQEFIKVQDFEIYADHSVKTIFSYLRVGILIIGVLSLIYSAFSILDSFLKRFGENKVVKISIKFIKLLFVLPFLPLYILTKISKKSSGMKWLVKFSLGIVFIPVWYGFTGVILFIFVSNFLGTPINVVGESMKPTFEPDALVDVYSYPGLLNIRKLNRGDVVIFSNEKIKKEGKDSYIKRAIALPGDRVMLKNGFVYLNNEYLTEPYILKPRSTFGGSDLKDCELITIPEDAVFVLGDNRKASSDSREFGLVKIRDIHQILPIKEQDKLKDRWRNTSKDHESEHSSVFDSTKYVDALNEKRSSKGVGTLKLNDKLSKSAGLRAAAMLKFDDLTWDARKSNYPMSRSTADAGYSNIIYAEYPLLGYYDEQELLTFMNENKSLDDFLLDKRYQDIGVSSFVGELNSCPTQIILIQLAGYIPPNYSKADIDSWKNALVGLREIQPSWQAGIANSTGERRSDFERINSIIGTRMSNISSIVQTMEQNKWLSSQQRSYMAQDQALYNEQEALASRLNRR